MTRASVTRVKPHINLGLDRFSGLYLWALFIIVFGIWTPRLFLSIATIHSIASEQAVTGMLGIDSRAANSIAKNAPSRCSAHGAITAALVWPRNATRT